MQAVADRYSRVITSPLTAVDVNGTETGTGAGWRIGFLHPGTSATFEISTAMDEATDPLILDEVTENPAEKYGFDGIAGIANPLIPLPSNKWILFSGSFLQAADHWGQVSPGLEEPGWEQVLPRHLTTLTVRCIEE
jgi:hypothetical protein